MQGGGQLYLRQHARLPAAPQCLPACLLALNACLPACCPSTPACLLAAPQCLPACVLPLNAHLPACLLPLNACLLATPNCLRACLAAAPHCVPAWMQGITVKVQPGAKPYGVSELSYTGTTPDGTSPYTLVGAGGTSPRYLSSGTLVVVP